MLIWYSIAQIGEKRNLPAACKDFVNFLFFGTADPLFMIL